MPKVTAKKMKELYEAIVQIKDAAECKNFFEDLCTIAELSAMSERFQVAKLVNAGIPYREISKKTGSSTATVTRVAHWLHHGKGGYKSMLERLV